MAFTRPVPGEFLNRPKGSGFNHLLIAAEKGDAGSQYNLAIVFANNLDDNHHPTAPNRAEAIQWLLKAAKQGLPRAQLKLAELYAAAPTTTDNDVRACAWFTVAGQGAAGAQSHSAKTSCAQIASRMTEAQLSKAARLARLWTLKPAPATAIQAIAGICAKKVLP